jgi:hypothetical protein
LDKHLHKDIGEQFSKGINSLSQQPREHIWENIDRQLDKTALKNYKDKLSRLRKRTLLLLLLLIGIATFSVMNFKTSRNESNHNSLARKKIKESIINNYNSSIITSKRDRLLKNYSIQQQTTNSIIGRINVMQHTEQGLFIVKKRKPSIKITNGTMADEETAENNKIEINKNITSEKPSETTLLTVNAKQEEAENKIPPSSQILKNDSLALSQNNAPSKSYKNKQRNNNYTLTAFVSPDYSEYRLENDKRNSYDNKAGIAKRERSDLSASLGVLLGYKIDNNVTIQSGIIYSSSNININPTKIYAEKDNAGMIKYRYNTSSGFGFIMPSFSASPAVGDSLFANGANHTLHYISMPLIAKFKLGNKKITFYPGVGVTFNFLTKATLTTDVEDRFNRETEYITKLESIRKIGYSLLLTPEIQYQLSKKTGLSAIPYFKYSLGAINKGNVVKTYPYTFGLGFGAVYKF